MITKQFFEENIKPYIVDDEYSDSCTFGETEQTIYTWGLTFSKPTQSIDGFNGLKIYPKSGDYFTITTNSNTVEIEFVDNSVPLICFIEKELSDISFKNKITCKSCQINNVISLEGTILQNLFENIGQLEISSDKLGGSIIELDLGGVECDSLKLSYQSSQIKKISISNHKLSKVELVDYTSGNCSLVLPKISNPGAVDLTYSQQNASVCTLIVKPSSVLSSFNSVTFKQSEYLDEYDTTVFFHLLDFDNAKNFISCALRSKLIVPKNILCKIGYYGFSELDDRAVEDLEKILEYIFTAFPQLSAFVTHDKEVNKLISNYIDRIWNYRTVVSKIEDLL